MKILHLSTQDRGGGGGGFDAAYRLHQHCIGAGFDSIMIVLRKESHDPTVLTLKNKKGAFSKLFSSLFIRVQGLVYHKILRISQYFIVNKKERCSTDELLEVMPFTPDVIITHWVSNFISAKNLHEINQKTGAPIFWYFMDMAPMTGGCHYAFECTGYMKQCGRCPQLPCSREKDVSYRQWHEKNSYLQRTDLTAVVGTTWLKKQAEVSSLFKKKRIAQIMLGMDIEVFRPESREKARRMLQLPVDKKIIFFGAHNIQEKRKGFQYLREALHLLYKSLEKDHSLRGKILVVTAGNRMNVKDPGILFDYKHLGLLQKERTLAAAYQAADVFVNASIEDAGPLMINESILCGTPVVAFDMGVAPDLVHTGNTGYRARLKDSDDLAQGIYEVLRLNNSDYRAMSQNCRELGLKLCHPMVQVKAFEELINHTRKAQG